MRCHVFGFVLRRPVAIALVAAVLVLPVALAVAGASTARTAAAIPPDGVVSGPARVIDGDTIDIAGTRVRLEGIDAPEAGQTCQTARGETWDCGNAATRVMVGLTQGRSVDCFSRGLDKYGRLLGICFVDGADINAVMVKRGYAWAFVRYSRHYVAEEADARAARAGVWQGPAIPAWEYRAQRWTAVAEVAPQGCAIKGNVSRTGLVYHMPWSPWYDKVAMAADKGKRWFCSEADALAAGWRPAMMR
jgi:endonuclease YncB( thermonuclease family)